MFDSLLTANVVDGHLIVFAEGNPYLLRALSTGVD